MRHRYYATTRPPIGASRNYTCLPSCANKFADFEEMRSPRRSASAASVGSRHAAAAFTRVGKVVSLPSPSDALSALIRLRARRARRHARHAVTPEGGRKAYRRGVVARGGERMVGGVFWEEEERRWGRVCRRVRVGCPRGGQACAGMLPLGGARLPCAACAAAGLSHRQECAYVQKGRKFTAAHRQVPCGSVRQAGSVVYLPAVQPRCGVRLPAAYSAVAARASCPEAPRGAVM